METIDWVGSSFNFEGNIFTEYGTKNEANALNEYCIQSGNHVEETGFHKHMRYKWLGGSPDGLIRNDGVVEFKCPWPKSKRLHDTDTMPLQYFVQCQVLMEVTNRSWCDLFIWHPEENRRWRFLRDQGFFDVIVPTLAQFHANMTLGQAPMILDKHTRHMQQVFVKKAMMESAYNMHTTTPAQLFSEVHDVTKWKNMVKQHPAQ